MANNYEKEQSKPDEIAINYSKADLLKSQQQLIYELFEVSIHFGSVVRSTANAQTKHMIQWIALHGGEKSRLYAKEYILAISNPEYTDSVKSSDKLIETINNEEFIHKVIKEHQVHICFEDNEIKLFGNALNVTLVRSLIEQEAKNLKNEEEKNAEIQETKPKIEMNFDESTKSNDDDVIFIDDPYEMLEKESKSKQKSNFYASSFIAQSFEKLNFNAATNDSVTPKPLINNSKLFDIAHAKGYTIEEIENARQRFGTTNIGENEFINFLKSNRDLKRLRVATNTPNLSPSEQPPANKRMHLQQQLQTPQKIVKTSINEREINDDCEIISVNKADKVLNEYKQMVIAQDYDEKEEKLNKEKRLSKLISAMPEDQQAHAMNQVNKYKTLTNSSSKSNSPIEFTNFASNDTSTTANHARPLSPKTLIRNQKRNRHISDSNNYNPDLYKSNDTSDSGTPIIVVTAKKPQQEKVLFTNFKQDDILNSFAPIQNNDRQKIKQQTNNKKVEPLMQIPIPPILQVSQQPPLAAPLAAFAQPQRHDTKKSNPKKRSKSSNPIDINSYKPQNYNQTDNNLRPIYIDGSNVARDHGKCRGNTFSCRGIEIVVNYFLQRGHRKVEVYVPRFRRGHSDHRCPTIDPEVLDKLDALGILKYTPSISYDDRFILETAVHHDGIIVSNDQYRDLLDEKPEWRIQVPQRLLQFVFSDDLFIPAADPLGRRGPKLDEFLAFPRNKTKQNQNAPDFVNRQNNDNSAGPGLVTGASNLFDLRQFDNNNDNRLARASNNNNSNTKINRKVEHKQPRQTTHASRIDTINNIQRYNQQPPFGGGISNNFRSVPQTTDLFNRLSAIFINSDSKITELLNNYPFEYDIEFFANILTESLF